MADLFEKNMAKASRKRDSNAAPRILTTRREALHLYREILRYSNLFVWRDDKGRMWRDVLRANARKVSLHFLWEGRWMHESMELATVQGAAGCQRTCNSAYWIYSKAPQYCAV